MRYVEIIPIRKLDPAVRQLVKYRARKGGAVKVIYTDEAWELGQPLNEDHESGCPIEIWLSSQALRRSGPWQENRDALNVTGRGGRCTCARPEHGWYATQKVRVPDSYWDDKLRQLVLPSPVITRFAPRPFTIVQALKYGELGADRAAIRVLADEMLDKGNPNGELLVRALHADTLPKV